MNPEMSVEINTPFETERLSIGREAPAISSAMVALERVLPKRYWVDINRLLVPFGKHVCTGRLPRCSVCPVLEYCRQIGVTDHR